MRRTAFFLGAIIALQACTTAPRSRDAGPPTERAPAPAATPEAALERTYRSSVPLCFDAALRVCRDRDIQVLRQDRRGEQAASLSAQGRSIEFTLEFARTPAPRTRATLRLQGRALPETREEATRLLDRLNEALLEPRE
ncbi:MAG TPA: hypothetical protein VNM14_24985 [Planctomycetota bacterium]|jgi:hypothetical protein|nr:hypothetical protein [Planctomycetota bacterium]